VPIGARTLTCPETMSPAHAPETLTRTLGCWPASAEAGSVSSNAVRQISMRWRRCTDVPFLGVQRIRTRTSSTRGGKPSWPKRGSCAPTVDPRHNPSRCDVTQGKRVASARRGLHDWLPACGPLTAAAPTGVPSRPTGVPSLANFSCAGVPRAAGCHSPSAVSYRRARTTSSRPARRRRAPARPAQRGRCRPSMRASTNPHANAPAVPPT
jgi:hypothetical protein